MKIYNDLKIEDLQNAFQAIFPYLKIEFYSSEHHEGEGSPVQQQLNSDKGIGEIRTIQTEGDLRINPDQKIAELEDHFLEEYGLNVQVFRKSGNLWLQTSTTDTWSLAKANLKGEHSVMHYQEKYQS